LGYGKELPSSFSGIVKGLVSEEAMRKGLRSKERTTILERQGKKEECWKGGEVYDGTIFRAPKREPSGIGGGENPESASSNEKVESRSHTRTRTRAEDGERGRSGGTREVHFLRGREGRRGRKSLLSLFKGRGSSPGKVRWCKKGNG